MPAQAQAVVTGNISFAAFSRPTGKSFKKVILFFLKMKTSATRDQKATKQARSGVYPFINKMMINITGITR